MSDIFINIIDICEIEFYVRNNQCELNIYDKIDVNFSQTSSLNIIKLLNKYI